MNKYEKLIEYIISEQEDLARELFHEIVVEKSRDIYESLIEAEPDMEEGMMGGSKVDELMHDVEADEGVLEADDELSDLDSDSPEMGMDDMGGDDEMGDDEGDEDMPDMGGDEDMPDMDDMGGEEGEEELEDRVMDLETALDDLKAEFDKLMAGEEGEEGEEDEGEEEDEEEMQEGMVREYVEKVAAPANTKEGHEAGAGGSASIQAKSPALQKANNMGGKAFDLGKGAEAAPDGQRPTGKAGGFLKPAQEIDVAKKNVNKPGGNKGAQDFYGTKAKAKSGEEGGVNKKSIESGN